jgi:hypothetical protein
MGGGGCEDISDRRGGCRDVSDAWGSMLGHITWVAEFVRMCQMALGACRDVSDG